MNKRNRMWLGFSILLIIIMLLRAFNNDKDERRSINQEADIVAQEVYNSVSTLFNERKYQQALDSINSALSTHGISIAMRSKLLRNKAVIFEEMYLKDSAIHCLKINAALYNVGSLDYMIQMAGIYELKHQSDSAILLFEKAWKANPNDLTINNNLGLLYMGYRGSDTVNFNKALPFNIEANRLLKSRTTEENLILNYQGLKMYHKVAEHYANLYEMFPTEHKYLYYLVLTLHDNLAQKDEAKARAKTLIQADSTYLNYQAIKIILE